MARYKLPDALGGGELPEDTGGVLDRETRQWLLRFDIPGVGVVRIAKDILVEIKPEPPEPPDKAMVCVDGRAWQRLGRWWYMTGDKTAWKWKLLCERDTPTPLVAVKPVVFPWLGASGLIIHPPDEYGDVLLQYGEGSLDDIIVGRDDLIVGRDDLRDVARALWTAADRQDGAT